MASQADVATEAARPMKYFSHDSNAAQDIKCRRLLRRLGMEGYGRWWRFCELLAATEGHKLSIETEEDAEIIAEELHLDGHKELMEYLQVLDDVGLIHMDGDGCVWSDRMLTNAEYFGKLRANGKRGGRPRKDA